MLVLLGAAPEDARVAEDGAATLPSGAEAKQDQALASKSKSIKADANCDAGEPAVSGQVLLLCRAGH